MNTKKIDAGTIARTIVLVLALVNQVLSATGHAVLPIEDAQVEAIVSNIWTVCAAVWAWWKNNSVTPAAIEADEVKKEIQSGKTVEVKDGSERRVNSL